GGGPTRERNEHDDSRDPLGSDGRRGGLRRDRPGHLRRGVRARGPIDAVPPVEGDHRRAQYGAGDHRRRRGHRHLDHHLLRDPLPAAAAPMSSAIYVSVVIVATAGLVYELLAAAAASYLLGDSITQFSTVIGAYLFAMGIGSFLSRYVRRGLAARF